MYLGKKAVDLFSCNVASAVWALAGHNMWLSRQGISQYSEKCLNNNTYWKLNISLLIRATECSHQFHYYVHPPSIIITIPPHLSLSPSLSCAVTSHRVWQHQASLHFNLALKLLISLSIIRNAESMFILLRGPYPCNTVIVGPRVTHSLYKVTLP